VLLFLTACAGLRESGGQGQPLAITDETDHRFASASSQPLGTQDDVAEIRRVIANRHSEMTIVEIKWLSPTKVLVDIDCNRNTSVGYEAYICTLKKRNGAWVWKGWYLALVS
jgi:hypothetical protein